MLKVLDEASRNLVSIIQRGFPLERRPFAELARLTGLSEEEALNRIRELKEKGFIAEISGIFNASALGYITTLVAMKVTPAKLDEAAGIISRHPGVGHNYSRDAIYNLWFTLSIPGNKDLAGEVKEMQEKAGAISSLILPSLRLYKIGVFIEIGNGDEEARMEGIMRADETETVPSTDGHISQEEVKVVRGLQKDLTLQMQMEPFKQLAESYNLAEDSFIKTAGSLQERKIMRRYAARLPHRQMGFIFNGMICWKTPEERKEETGKGLASSPWVTHCYERPAYRDWPYNLYSMIHGKTREECQEKAASLSRLVKVEDYVILFSSKEYKKERVKYFLEDHN